MILAVVSDVHGNLPALQAVLEHAKGVGGQEVWNLGDFTGYGPFPEECVQLLREKAVLNIVGNYDQKVLKIKKKREKWSKSKLPEKWRAFKWAFDHLSKSSRGYLKSLPESARKSVENWEIDLVHGSLDAIDEHLSPETPENRMEELGQKTSARVILCGHSHVPFTRKVQDKWFINPGSVGRVDDGDPRASYAVLSFEQSQLSVTHYRIPYPVDRTIQEIRAQNLPEDFAQMVALGRNLDYILKIRQISQLSLAISGKSI